MSDRYRRIEDGEYVLDRLTGEVHRAKPDDLGVARLKQSTRELVSVLGLIAGWYGGRALDTAGRLYGWARGR